MIRAIIMLTLAFSLALAAGVALGILAAAHPKDQVRSEPRSVIGQELNLTPAQNSEMETSWVTADARIRDGVQQRAEVQKQWDQAVYDLLTPEQKARYQELRRQYAGKALDIDASNKKAFDLAIQQTKQILTPEQQVKFDAMLTKRVDGGVPNNQNPSGATTVPSSVGLPASGSQRSSMTPMTR
jgi:Spy/CpxP family protein refolding chaperone